MIALKTMSECLSLLFSMLPLSIGEINVGDKRQVSSSSSKLECQQKKTRGQAFGVRQ